MYSGENKEHGVNKTMSDVRVTIIPLSRKACDKIECKDCEIAIGNDEESICFHGGKLAKYYGTLKED